MLTLELFPHLGQMEQLRLNPVVDPPAEERKNSKLRKRKRTFRQNNRVYNDAVVLWLMIAPRLKGVGTMENSVSELLYGLPDSFRPKPCKRPQPTADGEKPMRFQVFAPPFFPKTPVR